MTISDYSTNAALNTSLFPEGMPRRNINDSARVVQADIRAMVNGFPFFDIGTGTGPAIYNFVSSNSFAVANTDVTAFYEVGRRIRTNQAATGTLFSTITNVTFTSPNTLVTLDIDDGGSLANEALSVALSIVSPEAIPATLASALLTLISDDASANAAPRLDLFRNSASPANFDRLAQIAFSGNDSVGNKTDYVRIVAQAENVVNGSEAGRILIEGQLDLRDNGGPSYRTVSTSPTGAVDDLVGGLQHLAPNDAGGRVTYVDHQAFIDDPTAGSENSRSVFRVRTNGALTEVVEYSSVADFKVPIRVRGASGQIPVVIDLTNAIGELVRFSLNGTPQGSISINGGGVVSYNTFTGSHWAEFLDRNEMDPPEGTLLSTVDRWHNQAKGLPKVEVTKNQNCLRIYGVFGGRELNGIKVFSLGSAPVVRCKGPVQAGDLLTSSDTPGVAVRQLDDIVRSSTLGKAVQSDIRDIERPIAATIMAG